MLPSRCEEALDACFDLKALATEANAAVGDEPFWMIVDGARRRREIEMDRIARVAVDEKFSKPREVAQILEHRIVRNAEMISEQRRVIGADAKGDDRSCIAEHGLAQG